MDAPSAFALLLRRSREARSMTQAALAEACGLTGSYISLLESCRRPPPSDRVLRRLAEVLEVPAEELLRVAHLERAPGDVRATVDRLRSQAARERALRQHTAEALFPLSLWGLETSALPPGQRAAAGETPGGGMVGALSRLLDLARSSPDLDSFRKRSREALDALPEEERNRVLEEAPRLAEHAPVARVRRFRAASPALPPEVLPGDLLLVDPAADARPGDLVVEAGATHGTEAAVRRLGAGTEPHGGVVIEIRRRLR